MTRDSLEVASDHPAFAGHFPGRPVLPGAVLLDEVLELIARTNHLDLAGWRLSGAKFLSAIAPGERLTVAYDQQPSGSIRFVVNAGERLVANGTLTTGSASDDGR